MYERCFDQCLAQEEAEIRKEFQRFDLDKNGYITKGRFHNLSWRGDISASKTSIRRSVITEKAPTRAISWLKAATTAFTFKTLLRHYAKRALTPRSLNVKLGP